MTTTLNPLLKSMKTSGTTRTENGALTHVSSSSLCLDLFSRGAAYRTRTEADVLKLFWNAWDENPNLALKTLAYIRDIREGQGERRFFEIVLKDLAAKRPDVVKANFDLLVDYARWDNLLDLVDTNLDSFVAEKFRTQINADLRSSNPSLAAKWAPSLNTSSAETRRKANKFVKLLGLTPRSYRKTLSSLRKKIDIVENHLRTKDYDGIAYKAVPSRAMFKYKKAFGRNDQERFAKFLTKVEKGEEKINAATLYPYDLVRDAGKGADRTVDAQWKALPDYCKDNPHNGLVICDVSGSMGSINGYGYHRNDGTVQPIQVSISLALYFAERNVGPFKDHFITFSDTPKLQRVIGNSLHEKVKNLASAEWGMSTNLQAAFSLILQNAVKANVDPKDMPSVLYIVSDMEFNTCVNGTNYDGIKAKYEAAGYELPKVVFWNVQARNDQSPVKAHDRNTALVSGCSPTIFKTVLSGCTPMQVFLKTVNVPRYEGLVVPV